MFSPSKQLIFQKITAFKLFTDSYPMPLIEANFIYIKILLLGTLGYVYTLQRPTTYMIRPSRNKDLYKSSNPSKVNFDIKGTQFT